MSGVSSSRLGSLGSSDGRATGSAAERAYREAVKALDAAQKTLNNHLATGADEDTIERDEIAVQTAAAAVAAAAAALAQEEERARQRRREADERRAAPPETSAGETAALASLVAAGRSVDLYS
ncbi:hypothetical protein GTR02_08665 [Kineococcus sp. R8]|uniref:hypothetical protein n=1 Tax=Kineococcus siccus TaxID=2696567 RepID=UPI00196B3EC3|nr:hypothetical protein [Kineococcus siccus]NAZ81890.1 hypothetical protein [Kineococcus siccus]